MSEDPAFLVFNGEHGERVLPASVSFGASFSISRSSGNRFFSGLLPIPDGSLTACCGISQKKTAAPEERRGGRGLHAAMRRDTALLA
jgi:hypothetical protein